jgi:hypothetical protein
MIDSILKFKYILLIVSNLLLVSCKKTINCPGFPEGLKNYLPETSLLKFTNTSNDTLEIAINSKFITLPRTVSNNPLSEGGTGADPVCIEELTYNNDSYNNTQELVFYFNISLSSYGATLRLNLQEPLVSTSTFDVETSNTPSSLGTSNIFGDTLNLNCTFGRFSFAQIIYGQGIVKLYDVANNCEWTRVF